MTELSPEPQGPRAWTTALLAAALALYANISAAPSFFEPVYAVYGDTSNLYWLQSLLDPRLFPHDAWTALVKSRLTPFTLERAWFWLTGIFMRFHPYTLGLKVLSVLLFTLSALLIRRLARVSGARSIAAAAIVVFTALFLSMDTFYGVPRIYGAVIFLCFITAMQQKRFLLLAPIIAAAFIFYPPISVCLGIAAAAAPLFYRDAFPKARLASYAAALALTAVFILAARANSIFMGDLWTTLSSGQFQTWKSNLSAPGPLKPLPLSAILMDFVLNFNDHGRFYGFMFTLFAGIAAAGFLKRPGRPAFLPKAFQPVLTGSAAAFALLYPVHPAFASRQFVFVIPLLLVFLAAEGLERLTGTRYRGPALAAILALFVCFNPFLTELMNCRRYAPVYGYLSSTSTGAVIAAYPEGILAATIPIFPRRETFLTDKQTDLPTLAYGPVQSRERRAELLKALYLAGGASPEKFAERYSVDYLVLESEYYGDLFLTNARNSMHPEHLPLKAALSGEDFPDPAATYRSARERAVFSWSYPGGEGLVLDLRRFKGPETAK